MKEIDTRTAAQIAQSNHLSASHFRRGSGLQFVAECPKTLGSLARLVGLLVRDVDGRTMPVRDLALLVNASEMRVRAALHELAEFGLDIRNIK